MNRAWPAWAACLICAPLLLHAQEQITYPYVITLTGGPQAGFTNGPRAKARLYRPVDLEFGPGGVLYVLDMGNHAVREVAMDGAVTTLTGGRPGFRDGPAGMARFGMQNQGARGLVCGPDDVLYIADTPNHAIRWAMTDGVLGTLTGALWDARRRVLTSVRGFRDGPPGHARFHAPHDLDFRRQKWPLYVADTLNHLIRTVDDDGVVATLTGAFWDDGVQAWVAWDLGAFVDGAPGVARFHSPSRVTVGPHNIIYVGDQQWKVLRKVSTDGTVETWVGAWGSSKRWIPVGRHVDGPRGVGGFQALGGADFRRDGVMFITDWGSHTIRRIARDGTLSTLTGNPYNPGFRDGPAGRALFNEPAAAALGSDGVLYVADTGNHAIRKVLFKPEQLRDHQRALGLSSVPQPPQTEPSRPPQGPLIRRFGVPRDGEPR